MTPAGFPGQKGTGGLSRTIVEFMTDETACKECLAELGLNPFRA
jgi:hypothetical protein